MRYFKDRAEAGKMLAEQMKEAYCRQNCAVLALSEGGAMVGAEIAKAIHASLFLLTTQDITLPKELEPLASMSTAGTFTYSHNFSAADLEEINNEMRPIIDQMRLETFHKLNRVIGKDGQIDKRLLKNHTVIIVSDGFINGLSLDVAFDFLKSIKVKNTVVAAPLCNALLIDRIHLLSDAFYSLDVIEEGFPLSHYYADNTLPDHDAVVELMNNIALEW